MADTVSRCGSPLELEDGWTVGVPEQQGLDPALLCAMDQRLAKSKVANVHAIVVARHGVLVYERYSTWEDQPDASEPPVRVTFDASVRHNVNSATKSVISLLVGIAIDRGWIEELDAPVLSFFSEYADLRTPEKDLITLRHLLSMSDGLEWHEFVPPFDSWTQMMKAADRYRYVLERAVAISPGRAFNYNSGATELLGLILHKTSGRPIDVLAKDELFGALSVEDVEWRRFPNGAPIAANGLSLRPRDMVKIGQLVMDRGIWQGRQIVPASWISLSTAVQNNGPGGHFYGFQWWLGRSLVDAREIAWVGAFGWGGQRLIVVPQKDMVVFFAAWLPQNMALPEAVLLNQYILPAAMKC
jgi:CubicO group peptidase (beta-lactamase class C family)